LFKCGFFVVLEILHLFASLYRRLRCRADNALYNSLEGHEVWVSDHLPQTALIGSEKISSHYYINYSSNCNLITHNLDPS